MKLLAPLALLTIITTFAIPSQQQCKFNQKNDDKKLEGNHGTKEGEHYFKYLSVARPDQDGITMFYYLWNQHPKKLLAAEWRKAGVGFQRIRCGKCG